MIGSDPDHVTETTVAEMRTVSRISCVQWLRDDVAPYYIPFTTKPLSLLWR